MYNGTEIKQYEKVKYLGCTFHQSLSGESMALNVIDKHNFLALPLRRLLSNALTQPLFYYACTTWFSYLSKTLKLRLYV